jgi:hypothetical protein
MLRNLRTGRRVIVAACVLIGWAATGTATAQSACADLGGTIGPDQECRVHSDTSSYTLDFSFPVDYPSQQPLTDFLTQQRDNFVDDIHAEPAGYRPMPYSLAITASAYRSGTPTSGTRSLVFDIQNDEGGAHEGHPNTSYEAFNYDLSKAAPITFDMLFKPGTDPLAVLNPIVEHELEKHWGPAVSAPLHEAGVKAYRNFAITDDAVIFFLGEDQLLPDNVGPYQVSVSRTQLASILA